MNSTSNSTPTMIKPQDITPKQSMDFCTIFYSEAVSKNPNCIIAMHEVEQAHNEWIEILKEVGWTWDGGEIDKGMVQSIIERNRDKEGEV